MRNFSLLTFQIGKVLFIVVFFLFSWSTSAQLPGGFKGYRVDRVDPLFDYDKIAAEGENLSSESPNQQQALSIQVERIWEQLSRGNMDEVISHVNQLIEEYPDYQWGYYLKGVCFKRIRQYDSAEFTFKKVFETKATQAYVATHIELGYLYLFNFWDNNLAEKHFVEAMNLWPDSPTPLYAMAYYYYYTKKFNKSISYAEMTIEKDKGFLPAYFIMLDIWKVRLQFEIAQEITLKMLEVSPDNEQVLLTKAALYFETDEDEFALQTIDYLLRQHPENVKALKIMSDHYYEEEKQKEGFEYTLKYLELVEELGSAPFPLRNIRFKEQFYRALKYVKQEMYSYDEFQLQELFAIVRTTIKLDWWEARDMAKAWDDDMESIPTGLLMFRAILFEKETDSYYWRQDNITITNRDSTLYYNFWSLGDYYEFYEFHEKAETQYTKMIAINPVEKIGLKLRGRARMNAKKYRAAVQDFNIYLDGDSSDIVTYESRAECYKQMGYLDLAIIDLQFAFDRRKKGVLYETFLDLYSYKLTKKDTLGAIDLIEEALNKNQRAYFDKKYITNHELLNLRGLTNLSLQKKDLAKADFSKSIEAHPGFNLPWLNRGIIRFELGEFFNAKEDFDQFIKLSEDKGPGYFWRGKARLFLNDKAGAKKDLKMALKLGVQEAAQWLKKAGY